MLLTRWFHSAMEFVFPGRCAGCEADCDGRSPLCPICQTQFESLATHPACGRCASPLAYSNAPCPYCRGEGMKPFERIAAICTFDDPIRQMVYAFKYHGAWPFAEYLADHLIQQESFKALLHERPILIPVPLHPLRQLSRGYNQADLIARRLANKCRLKLSTPLVRLRHTETQTHLHSKAKRDANMKDAFGLARPSAVRGKHVVLVDDVMTTGATLRSAAREVRKGSPASISAVVLAVADPKGHGFTSA